jgi:putative peptide zinc metalloprotease protein
MTVVETRVSVWEALAGRAPGQPLGPADPGLWAAVVERLNPARATPRLRAGIEQADLVSVRGVPYVMLRSPDDGGRACYLRLSPEEAQLADLMDGTLTVARLVAEFARICGRLAPDQVRRVVADLAANRMLEELPLDAFRPLERVHRRPWPMRLGRAMLAVIRGRRTVVANVDPLVSFLYRAGGRWLFTRVAAALLSLVAAAGVALFCWSWATGTHSLFLTGGSYVTGAAVLLGLNVVALACHELGHALATKHAGRRVPAAGFLIYFGIPSIFVDTTDVWMAGRRARLLTTAAGPSAGLVLAGLAQLLGLAVPSIAPWAFVVSFAWYLNALFNLNPLLALDGYYLLMDWLEVPNLRARGLAWVFARLRFFPPARPNDVRPPAWRQLDREGRLVALYGMVAVAWLVIVVNIGWRIWTDRVAGLTLGLWRQGWAARLLLFAVVAALAAPAVYAFAGWIARRWRRLRARLGERRAAADLPRRLAVLRTSVLAQLPPSALTTLAARATWLHPRTGEPVVLAGGAQPSVLVVADGALEARRPGDPSGTVRQRVGPGGVVGLASALTGAPASLSWHTAGTRLLAVPAPVVANAVGPLPGPPPADRAEAEQLFAETPALEALPREDLMGLVASARPIMLPPGAPVELANERDAVVVAAGEIALADGTGLRRGTMIGPLGEQPTGPVATARTPVRLWSLPAVSGLPLLLAGPARAPGGFGVGVDAAADPGVAPVIGVHSPTAYPPLASPPGPPPEGVDEETDRRFERKLWWLLLLLLLLGLLITGGNLLPGPAWAEMPTDRALLVAENGRVTTTVGGEVVVLEPGQKLYVGAGDRVEVGDRASGRLTYRGGAQTLLCGGSRAQLGALWSDQSRPIRPHAEVDLRRGRLLADTTSGSPTFAHLVLDVGNYGHATVNEGAARHTVGGGETVVATGTVIRDGTPVPATLARLSCGGPVPTTAPPTGTPTDPPSGVPTSPAVPTPTATPTAIPTATTPAGVTPGPGNNPVDPTPEDPADPGTPNNPTTAPPTTRPPTQPPPDTTPPTINGTISPDVIAQIPPAGAVCLRSETDATTAVVTATIRDARTPAASLKVSASWTGLGRGGGLSMSRSGSTWTGNFSINYEKGQEQGGAVVITVVATDTAGNSAEASEQVSVAPCIIQTPEQTPQGTPTQTQTPPPGRIPQ